MIVEVIDVRVRSLVVRNCRASSRNASSPDLRSSDVTSRLASSASATQRCTSCMVRPSPSAAACRRAVSTRRACVSQNSRSPALPVMAPAASMSAARSAAVTGFVQPVSGSNVIVDPSPASPTGLKT